MTRRLGSSSTIVLLLGLGLAGSSGLLLAPDAAAEEITTIDGRWTATVESFERRGGAWQLVTDKKTVPLEDLVHVRFDAKMRDGALPEVVLWLGNGDRIAGRIRGGSALGLQIRNRGLLQNDVPSVEIPLEKIRGLVFPHNISADQTVGTVLDRLLQRKGRRDEVHLKAGTQTDGIIEKFGMSSLEITNDRLGTLPIPYDKIRAVRIIEEKKPEPVQGTQLVVCLSDGSRITGAPVKSEPQLITIDSPVVGTVVIPTSKIMVIYAIGGRSVYLSDLDPEEVKPTPFFPNELSWRPYVNRDMTYGGGPLSLEGVTYPKGLGCHSKVEVTYSLGGNFDALDGLVGIDDEVSGGRGNVVFKVLLDGREVFSSGEIGHADGAKAVHLDLRGKKKLTLVVDFGRNLHVQDRADWADLRLTRALRP